MLPPNNLPEIDPASSLAEEVFIFYKSIGDSIFQLYGHSKPMDQPSMELHISIRTIIERCTASNFSLSEIGREYPMIKEIESHNRSENRTQTNTFINEEHFIRYVTTLGKESFMRKDA